MKRHTLTRDIVILESQNEPLYRRQVAVMVGRRRQYRIGL
jgi:hypothetical protein